MLVSTYRLGLIVDVEDEVVRKRESLAAHVFNELALDEIFIHVHVRTVNSK